MRCRALWIPVALLSGCFLDEPKESGPLDGEWRGLAGDGTELTLAIDQTQKASSGDHLVGTGTVTWHAADGVHVDSLLLEGGGTTSFVLELRRSISFSAGNPLQPIYVTGSVDASGAGATATLTGDD